MQNKVQIVILGDSPELYHLQKKHVEYLLELFLASNNSK